MKIFNTKYAYVGDVLPENVLEQFNNADLPWSFGDCALSCIRPAQLLEWLEEQGDDVSDEDFLAVKKALDADPDVLIAL